MFICVMITSMEIKTYTIYTEKLNKQERPLRIIMLADLHNRLWGKHQGRLQSLHRLLHYRDTSPKVKSFQRLPMFND